MIPAGKRTEKCKIHYLYPFISNISIGIVGLLVKMVFLNFTHWFTQRVIIHGCRYILASVQGGPVSRTSAQPYQWQQKHLTSRSKKSTTMRALMGNHWKTNLYEGPFMETSFWGQCSLFLCFSVFSSEEVLHCGLSLPSLTLQETQIDII